MKHYEEDVIRRWIKQCLADPNPDEALMRMLRTVTETCYAQGKREVQCELIRVLDLRHLLG